MYNPETMEKLSTQDTIRRKSKYNSTRKTKKW